MKSATPASTPCPALEKSRSARWRRTGSEPAILETADQLQLRRNLTTLQSVPTVSTTYGSTAGPSHCDRQLRRRPPHVEDSPSLGLASRPEGIVGQERVEAAPESHPASSASASQPRIPPQSATCRCDAVSTAWFPAESFRHRAHHRMYAANPRTCWTGFPALTRSTTRPPAPQIADHRVAVFEVIGEKSPSARIKNLACRSSRSGFRKQNEGSGKIANGAIWCERAAPTAETRN